MPSASCHRQPPAAARRGRYGPPLALLLAIVAVAATVGATMRDAGARQDGAPEQTTARTEASRTGRRELWIVRSGHTLSEIAGRTRVSAKRIGELNPGVDLGSLQIGQRIRVRRLARPARR